MQVPDGKKLIEEEQLMKKRYKRYYTWIGPLLKKPQAKAYTFLILSIFTVAFFIFFAIRPTINTIIGLQKQIKDNQEVDTKLQDKINSLSQLQAELEVIQPDLPVLDAALPTKSEVVSLIKSLESLAKENNASLSAMQIGTAMLSEVAPAEIIVRPINQSTAAAPLPEPVQELIPVSFVLTVEGNYADIANLIKKITNLPRIISTQSVVVLKSSGKIIGNIRFNAFYLPKGIWRIKI